MANRPTEVGNYRRVSAVLGEIGWRVRRHVVQDLTALSSPITTTFEVEKPSGATASWTATQVPSSSEGWAFLEYATSSGDLNEQGLYQVRPRVQAPSFDRYYERFWILVRPVHEERD